MTRKATVDHVESIEDVNRQHRRDTADRFGRHTDQLADHSRRLDRIEDVLSKRLGVDVKPKPPTSPLPSDSIYGSRVELLPKDVRIAILEQQVATEKATVEALRRNVRHLSERLLEVNNKLADVRRAAGR